MDCHWRGFDAFYKQKEKKGQKHMIKGILMDYGGTIDTNGIHWAEVIYDGYQKAGIKVPREAFREAYVYAERQLEKDTEEIKEHDTFLEVMQRKVHLELGYLVEHRFVPPTDRHKSAQLAEYYYAYARSTATALQPTLAFLAQVAPIVLISNFYGNLAAVLHDFGLRPFFTNLVESARVGTRKPESKIFEIAMDILQTKPSETAMIGDSYKNDILPANRLGCITVWLKNKGWDKEPDNPQNPPASFIIKNLTDCRSLTIFNK
jgi:putative hydrolase of the HAD superfamily